MPQIAYTVTQIREIQVEADSPEAAIKVANRALYSDRLATSSTVGKVLSTVRIKDISAKEGVEV